MIFQAETLEETYKKAAEYFECSVTEFKDIKLIQAPSNMLFGFIKKDAIVEINFEKPVLKEKQVEANVKSEEENKSEENKKEVKEVEIIKPKEAIEKIEIVEEEEIEDVLEEDTEEEKKIKKLEQKIIEKKEQIPEKKVEEVSKPIKIEHIEDNNIDKISKIEDEINELFKLSCFNLDPIKVRKFDEETILIVFDGEDSALLIGKEGYRYNALSYMLFNWINQKYNLRIRLEVSKFLENQEEMMEKLLVPTIDLIEKSGKAITKPFDGILLHIAVDILRKRFPNKYVGVKLNRDNQKYIVINEFLNKND